MQLVGALASMPRETEWVEFKHNNAVPDDIGEYVSALSNAAALHGERTGYLVWGVHDETHEILGTTFEPRATKVGNQELESWLVTNLVPRLDLRFHERRISGRAVVVLEVPAARSVPVRFKETEFIRVGTYKNRLKDHPEKERALWAIFGRHPFEEDVALENLTGSDVLELLDFPSFFRLAGLPLPPSSKAILDRLAKETFVSADTGGFTVTNLGATLFARDLNQFPRLGRKALRVVFYRGRNKAVSEREHVEPRGYAAAFEEVVRYINDRLPASEGMGEARRTEVRSYPQIAVRELVANALIHQDFAVGGAGPMVEAYADRVEIINPGAPLISVARFIDEPPRSRNESIAAFMRRVNICEERGSGIDKVILAAEEHRLPPPDFRVVGDNTVSLLFAPKRLAEMSLDERRRACYQHACLCYVNNQRMTNSTLRERLGIEASSFGTASNIIRDTLDAGLVKPADPASTSRRYASYVPFWA